MPEHRRFGLFPVRSPLLGESFLLSLPAGTKMIQFPAFASASRIWRSLSMGCPIRTSAGLCAFAARRSFSQLITSFFASESLGIPHAPFSFRYFFFYNALNAMSFALICSCETLLFLLCVFSFFTALRQLQTSSLVIVLCMVENNGFEPLTPCLQSRCSSQLS